MAFLIHATPKSNLQSIRKNGLVPCDEPVHLADEIAFAAISATCVHDCEDDDLAILFVNVNGLDLGPGYDGEGSHTYAGVIEPKRISVAIPM